ncbi:M56 family metallopeptidase [Algoriphagus sp. CAU 1675]|uniref:M56 family metallopeptidase n=1 Tax=Algoriphagus sp. CAU 1675 TaxID=3032597 RepID=UPI0023DAF4DF|nr:M56 family metallopeptidase [Algoriphagus sp. CAU 1675]MDF2157181.1 M56 family metallopeptidase [Algoriphagus sp. CAU 1675]
MEYLLTSIVCLLILLAIHRLILQQEVFHMFNRFYLLFSVVASFLIPLNTFETEVLVEPMSIEEGNLPNDFEYGTQNFDPVLHVDQRLTTEADFSWKLGLGLGYGLISLIFLFRFFNNIRILRNKISRNIRVTYRGQVLVLLEEDTLPYTFLQFIFVNREKFENEGISDAVFEHELAHVKGKHSWDILLIELLIIPFWFHPGLYWAKQSIQMNHEFIADRIALRKSSLLQYQQELLQLALFQTGNSLVSNLNFSLTKKRLEMMKKKTKPTIRAIKFLALLPLLGLVIYGFSEKRVIEKVNGQENQLGEKVLEGPVFHLLSGGKFEFEGKVYEKTELKKVLEETSPIELLSISAEPKISMGEVADFQSEFREMGIRKILYVNDPKIWPQRNERINNLTDYLNDLQEYKERLATGVHFIHKPKNEQLEIMELFLDIGGRYFRLQEMDKKKAERPKHPYAPYVKLENEGEVYYKLRENLTEEEKASLPAPPPPAPKSSNISMLNVYKDLYFTYELNRNEKDHFIYKSKQEALLNQFLKVESAFFALDYSDKKLVSRPTNPQYPYVKLLKEGKEIFKLPSELTQEEKEKVGC